MQRKDSFVQGEYYHIYNRGIDKRAIFLSDRDYERFMILLRVANSGESFRLDNLINQQKKNYMEIMAADYGDPLVEIGAWCLMPNHFHLLIKEKKENGIVQFMRKLGTGYSMYFNIKRDRSGALLCRPFRSVHIKDDNHLRHLFGYLHLNPLNLKFPSWKEKVTKQEKEVKAMKTFLHTYRFSSCLDYMRQDKVERVEENIIFRRGFPKYFSDAHDFEDFLEDYISLDDEFTITT